MIRQTLWIERKFNFDFPVGLFPNILERVRGTPARLEEMIRRWPESILTERIGGKWSIQEHVGHLLDLDDLHDRRIDDFIARTPSLRPADMSNKKTSESNHHATPIETLLDRFRTTRMAFVKRLQTMDEAAIAFSSLHPRLQQNMRLVDMIFFAAEHDDHHLAVMRALANSLIKK
jgi:uncharacterized damage-inducible protein DinB